MTIDHIENDANYKGLKVNKGIEQPSDINEDAVKNLKRKKELSVDEYIKGITEGDRSILAKAITLIESAHPKHLEMSQEIIKLCLPFSGKSIRVGITGVPGVGKSSFIETIGKYLTSKGHKLAVLAIDPSSELSKGSILGDKTRMEELATDKNAFIRPSPSAGTLGGVARKTRESIVLCEAAGYDIIFVETVGVGQSETAVHSMVDCFLLLMLAGAGDELQGIKRGIMEMADIIAITKADGNNINKASLAKTEYTNALHLFPPQKSGWIPKADVCSARTKMGIDNIWEMVWEHKKLLKDNGYFNLNRQQQSKYWMYETINETLKNHFYENDAIKNIAAEIEQDVLLDKTSSFSGAKKLLDLYFNIFKNKKNKD